MSGRVGKGMSDKDIIVDRLINEAGLREFKERHFTSEKGKQAPIRRGPVSTRRQWFDTFMLEMDSMKAGTFSVKVSTYNLKTGGLAPILRTTGLSRYEADNMYEKSRSILLGE